MLEVSVVIELNRGLKLLVSIVGTRTPRVALSAHRGCPGEVREVDGIEQGLSMDVSCEHPQVLISVLPDA